MSGGAQWLIYDLVKKTEESAQRRWVDAKCSLAASQAGHAEWAKANPDDGAGSFGSNPYSVKKAADHLEAVEARWAELKEAVEVAARTFLTETDDESDA